MTDLHAALEAAIRARLEVARAALTVADAPWHYKEATNQLRDDDGQLLADRVGYRDGRHMVLHDPADAIRRYERDLKVLDRHAVCTGCELRVGRCSTGEAWCHWCTQPAPCVERRDLLDVYLEVIT